MADEAGSRTLPFPLAISEFTTMPWPFARDVETYARLGFDGIELCEEKLDAGDCAAQVALIHEAGLVISSVQPKVRTFLASRMQSEPRDPDERFACFAQSIERIAPHTPGAIFVANTGAPDDGNLAKAERFATNQLRRLADIAERHDIRIALEPLNPAIVNVETAIWTIDQALEIVEVTGSDRIGICLDLWNVWQQADLESAIARAGSRIFALQVSDWRTPRSFADRLVPGDGVIPLGPLLHQIYNAGYHGVCAIEIFSKDVPDSLWEGDLVALLQRSRAGLRAAWQEVAAG